MFDVSLDPSGPTQDYYADAGSRRFLYMRLLSDFERFPALHFTLAYTPLHFKQLRDVVQTRPQKK